MENDPKIESKKNQTPVIHVMGRYFGDGQGRKAGGYVGSAIPQP
jgi:hypothetical protein